MGCGTRHGGLWTLPAMAVAVVTQLSVGEASAMVAPSADPFVGLMPMTAEQLKEHRGGFTVMTPLGATTFDFGVTVTTNVDTPLGNLSMTTSVTFNDSGQVAEVQSQTSGTLLDNGTVAATGLPAPAAAPAGSGAAAPAGVAPAAVANPSGGSGGGAPAPSVASSGSSKGVSVAVNTPGLQILHDIASDHVTFAAAATGSGMSVTQSAVLDLAFQNFSQIRTQLQSIAAVRRITRDLGTLLVR